MPGSSWVTNRGRISRLKHIFYDTTNNQAEHWNRFDMVDMWAMFDFVTSSSNFFQIFNELFAKIWESLGALPFQEDFTGEISTIPVINSWLLNLFFMF